MLNLCCALFYVTGAGICWEYPSLRGTFLRFPATNQHAMHLWNQSSRQLTLRCFRFALNNLNQPAVARKQNVLPKEREGFSRANSNSPDQGCHVPPRLAAQFAVRKEFCITHHPLSLMLAVCELDPRRAIQFPPLICEAQRS